MTPRILPLLDSSQCRCITTICPRQPEFANGTVLTEVLFPSHRVAVVGAQVSSACYGCVVLGMGSMRVWPEPAASCGGIVAEAWTVPGNNILCCCCEALQTYSCMNARSGQAAGKSHSHTVRMDVRQQLQQPGQALTLHVSMC
jgi:hypothetical protein